jgi:aspartate-semialdehyde dehydrogenase
VSGPGWKVAVLGATGAVGRTMLACLEESCLPLAGVRPLCSPRSEGTRLSFRGEEIVAHAVAADSFAGCDLALFSAGASASGEWAPRARDAGAWVVDNSSRWRMDPSVALVVPEVNPHHIPGKGPAIIANPNCSTIQMVVALEPIRARFGLRRVFVSTYQSASGKGHAGMQALEEESRGRRIEPPVFPGRLLGNCLPQCDVFLEDGSTKEELKMILETRKIMDLPELRVHPTCVRVPVAVAHAEALYLETKWPCSTEEAQEVLAASPGIRLLDDPGSSLYPTPLEAAGSDPVWVGRVHQDREDPCGLYLWVVADNLRKGAALNAVQIAETIWRRKPEPRGN